MFDPLAVFGLPSFIPTADAVPVPLSDIDCPFCQSRAVQFDGPLEVDRYAAGRYARCGNCRHEWTDVFELTAYPA
jgi:hypothetical protein